MGTELAPQAVHVPPVQVEPLADPPTQIWLAERVQVELLATQVGPADCTWPAGQGVTKVGGAHSNAGSGHVRRPALAPSKPATVLATPMSSGPHTTAVAAAEVLCGLTEMVTVRWLELQVKAMQAAPFTFVAA